MANASRSSTPKSTTASYDHYWPLTGHLHHPSYATHCPPSTGTSALTPTTPASVRIASSTAAKPWAPSVPSEPAASSASRVTSAVNSDWSALTSPPDPDQNGRGLGFVGERRDRSGLADRLVDLHDLGADRHELLIVGQLAADLVHLRAGRQLASLRPATGARTGPQLPWPVTWMLRRRAGTVSLAALAVVLRDRSAAKVTDIDEFGVALGALLFEVGKQGRHHRKTSYSTIRVTCSRRTWLATRSNWTWTSNASPLTSAATLARPGSPRTSTAPMSVGSWALRPSSSTADATTAPTTSKRCPTLSVSREPTWRSGRDGPVLARSRHESRRERTSIRLLGELKEES